MRNVSVYAKPHGSGNEGGKRGTANYNITKVINNITNVNNTNIPQDLNVRSIRADKADFGDLNATSIYVTNGNITYLIASDGTINKLKGNEIEYTLGNIADLFTDNTTTNKLTVEDTATIQKLISQYIQSTNITTDYLTVNKSAHFFELIVDKLRSTKGTEIQTAANCVIDFVEAYNSNDQKIDPTSGSVKYYKVYWRNRDADGKKMENDWLEYDQALCETYNITQGTSYHTRNKYYWRLVEDTDNGTPAYINFDKQEVWSKSGTPNSTIEFGDIYFEHNDGVTIDINNFDVYAEESGTYDPSTYKWNPTSTLYGLVIEPFEMINGEKVRISLSDGYFCFETFDYSKISITFYYDDGTIKYIKEPNAYNLEYINGINANLGVNKIVLHTAIIDKWDECNWIRLSNTVRDSLKAGKSPVPDVGDNLAQLGYRYQMLPDYEDTDEWYEEHPDEVGRASAIITSAYATPDNGGTYEGKTYPPIKPPSFVQYGKITDFRLFTHRLNVVSHGFNSFRGDFRTMAGDELATHSELIQTADEIRLEVTEQIENIKFEKVETIDATSLDPSKCYPVTINFNQSNDSKQIRCAVSRTLIQTYGVPNYSTHTRGFVIDLDWTTRASGWGTNWVERRWYVGDKTRFIQEFELHYTNQTDKVVGSIGQVTEASIEVVYVRGGSKYDILTSFKDATITLHPTGYTWENEEYAIIDDRPVIDYTDLVVPVKDRMGRSEIIQTADNIQLNVYNELNIKTGIDVSNGTITLDGDKTTITGDLDIKGLTTENVTRVTRATSIPTIINMGVLTGTDTDDTHKIKSVQVGQGIYEHFVVLPFYDSNFNNWKNQTDITFAEDGSFDLFEENVSGETFAPWQRKVVPYKVNGTKLTITNEVQAEYRNWKSIETYSEENKRIYSNMLLGTVIVCSDGRVFAKENINSYDKQFHPDNLSGSLEAAPILKGGCFSCGGYYSRFIALAPGQTLQLRSQIITIGSSEVLIWVVENDMDFVPLLNSVYEFMDGETANTIVYQGHNLPVFNPADAYNAILECVLSPNVMNYQTQEVTNTGKGKFLESQLYY